MKKRMKKTGRCRNGRGRVACRAFSVLLLLFGAFSLLPVGAFAYDGESYSIMDERTEGILEELTEILPDGMEELADPVKSADTVGLKPLLECIFDVALGSATRIGGFFMTLIGLSMLSSLASVWDGDIGRACRASVSVVSAAVILDEVFALVEEIGEALGTVNGFFASLIPIVGAVNALGLSFNLASAQAVGMTLSLEIYSFLSGSFLYSFVGALTAIAALSAIDPVGFGRIGASVRKAFLWCVGILTAFVGATFSLQSLISSYADSGVMRSARYAVSGMIPIVGSSISGALGVLAGGFAYLKGAVGGGGIAAIISLSLAPLIMLLLYRAALGVAIFFSEVCLTESGGLFGAFAFALDAMIATYSLTVVIYVVQLTVFLMGGVSLA